MYELRKTTLVSFEMEKLKSDQLSPTQVRWLQSGVKMGDMNDKIGSNNVRSGNFMEKHLLRDQSENGESS